MQEFDPQVLNDLYRPPADSHKGQNGKLLVIGGSHLFHAASLWALHVASRIVDMVFYASVPENNFIVQEAKEEFRNGIVVPRKDVENYIREADCILIGPGMVRAEIKSHKSKIRIENLSEIDGIPDEGEQTFELTKYLLTKYTDKRWVIDAGALQMLNPEWLFDLNQLPILTPHPIEFQRAFSKKLPEENDIEVQAVLKQTTEKYHCVILLKGQKDFVVSPDEEVRVNGGNAGMTKGGTGDVLAGLTASLYCKNPAFLSAASASYINKRAGEALFAKVGYYFNASDLADEIPKVMKQITNK